LLKAIPLQARFKREFAMLAIDQNPLNILEQKKYNVTQAAALLGMSRTSLNRLREKGDAPDEISIAGHARFLEKDLVNWLVDQNPKLKDKFELMESARTAFSRSAARANKAKNKAEKQAKLKAVK
tara:strand:+ start:932 stop:1306 length:375 start_codon:yes stop_codon:yes gene_type:complete